MLHGVLKGYPGIVTDVTRLKFDAPFQCFVHRWDDLAAAQTDPKWDGVTREHTSVLFKILKNELGEIIQLREDCLKTKTVSFEHVWTLFPPGCTVWGSKNSQPIAAKFTGGNYAKTQCGNVYALDCKIIDWDGNIMGWSDHRLSIPEYLGTTSFSNLPCFPFNYHPQVDVATMMLLARGRRFEELAGYHYKAYKGVAIYRVDGEPRREHVQSRIVIDGANWETENPSNVVYITSLHVDADGFGGATNNYANSDASCNASVCSADFQAIDDKEAKLAPLTPEQLLLTSPIVRGYSLKNKRWMEFLIDSIEEIQFDNQAFSSLVLPEETKELVLAFAQSQVKYRDNFDDIISGKGKGIIMLLSGGPGIGKTLTAESVAEEMRVPLYVMSAGDLGANSYEVDSSLTRILAMVGNWNAVLLLDECDVFLEERTPHDIERNRIVSIFLRTLEYYEGILFLTTNRVKSMDLAFQSRIHISLEYPPLDSTARAAVWKAFLGRTVGPAVAEADGADAGAGSTKAASHDISEEQLLALSQLDLNGRQIKNVLKAGNLLACHKNERLCFEHLRKVLRIEGHSL